MADFVAVLRKTIGGLGETTPEVRQRVYDKARATIEAKLAQISPPPPAAVAERQRKALEDAIGEVEAGYAPPPSPAAPKVAKAPEPPADDLESIFASLSEPRPRQTPRGGATPAPSKATTPAPIIPQPVHERTAEPAAPIPPDAFEPIPPEHGFDGEGEYPEEVPAQRSRRRAMALLLSMLVLAVLAAAAYAAWLDRERLSAMLGIELPPFAVSGNAPALSVQSATPQPPAGKEAAAPPPAAEKPAETPAAAPPPVQKFTQRLAADGTESDPGPAGGEAEVGEGTSVAAVTPPPAGGGTAAQPPAAASGAAPAGGEGAAVRVPIGQRAIFYEERTNAAQGSADTGSTLWSIVQEAPGADLPPEPAIRAEASIPAKNLQLRMTIRRNGDKTLPASHIVELIFLTPDNFEGGGIDNVLRVAMKDSEQAPGSPLVGIPARISDGFFLLALNDGRNETAANVALMRRESWIDIPLVYKSGRRALITLEKGVTGNKVFNDALNAWQAAAAPAQPETQPETGQPETGQPETTPPAPAEPGADAARPAPEQAPSNGETPAE